MSTEYLLYLKAIADTAVVLTRECVISNMPIFNQEQYDLIPGRCARQPVKEVGLSRADAKKLADVESTAFRDARETAAMFSEDDDYATARENVPKNNSAFRTKEVIPVFDDYSDNPVALDRVTKLKEAVLYPRISYFL